MIDSSVRPSNNCSVKFFKTKLSITDRCYDRDSYDKYLADDNVFIGIIYNNGILPNVDFYFDEKQLISGKTIQELLTCNYITFWYGQVTYGAFITSIKPTAVRGRWVVSHVVDNWYMSTHLYSDTFHMHGQCVRAHVNDFTCQDSSITADSILTPTLDNTYDTPEEEFRDSGVAVKTYKLFSLFGQEANWAYIYIYINNPGAFTYYGDTLDNLTQVYDSKIDGAQKGVLTGMLLCGVITLSTGMCCFDIDNQPININNITSQYATIMYISKVPIKDLLRVKLIGGNYRFDIDSIGTVDVDYKNIHMQEGSTNPKTFPTYALLFKNIDISATIETNSLLPIENYYGYTLKGRNLSTDYAGYVARGIPKVFDGVYNPGYIADRYVDMFYAPTLFRVGYSPDGGKCWVNWVPRRPGVNYNELGATQFKNSYGQFAPDAVLDYWTEINAKRATLSAEKAGKSAVIQGVSSIGNAITSAVGGVAQSFINPTGALSSAVGGLFRAGTEIAQASTDMYYNTSIADINKEIAQQQYKTGEITSDLNTGYYATLFDGNLPLMKHLIQSPANVNSIAERLHRYGYNTFLQIDEIYKNHRRRYFNYIKCPNIEVHGVPLDVASDIEKMFSNGVHLWTVTSDSDIEKVGEFETSNWQKDLIDRLAG